jgi:sterol desaturase/sphingolipid hydroxylase (fatty acid hydroxylase superfamily)
VIALSRTPHWHHTVAPIDRNFAVHLPVLDAMFGALYLPGDEGPPA